MKIVLIGFMGSGKSSVAPRLARQLDLQAVEMDDLIVERAGKSVADVFSQDGENAFRELEAAVGQSLRDQDQVVISTGGGVVMDESLMDTLADGALVIHLDTSFKTAVRRAGGGNRPLIADKEKARALYESRRPLYSKYGALRIDTGQKSVNEVVEAIITKMGEKPS